jgi:multidrug efflux pump subunit AcrA (membrane-fusion protein)
MTAAHEPVFLGLVGCRRVGPSAAESAAVSRPAETPQVAAAALRPDLGFPGRVRAVRGVDLGFNGPGRIIAFAVSGGQSLPAGALIARLDPADYETAPPAARAELDAAADHERRRQLREKGQAVPRAEVERKPTDMDVAPLLFDPFFESTAVTILFGLAFATLLTPVVVPLLDTVLFEDA